MCLWFKDGKRRCYVCKQKYFDRSSSLFGINTMDLCNACNEKVLKQNLTCWNSLEGKRNDQRQPDVLVRYRLNYGSSPCERSPLYTSTILDENDYSNEPGNPHFTDHTLVPTDQKNSKT